ncbi:putative two-component system response regulator [Actinacidiphila reveromycinica]|uniref:Putative two-component system response regulator n=1 Tax=Actinacidiphila reveromycinica TaxID=659352 RepID=A0A7U3VN02_9ACTN|nr:putative two-component system response regulator [Streptomyces sp. SN-593]
MAHDTCLLRSALAALLGREADFEVTDTAWPLPAETERSLRPDVCVVDADCTGWRQHVGAAAGPFGGSPGGALGGPLGRPVRAPAGAVAVRGGNAARGQGTRAAGGNGGPRALGAGRPANGGATGGDPRGGDPRGAGPGAAGGWPRPGSGGPGRPATHGPAVTGPGGGPARTRCALVVLTGPGRPGDLRRAHEAHALGFVNKDRSADRLPTAVRQAAQGKRFVDESLAVEFLHAADMPLTRRELSVLSLSAEGAPVTEIAHLLHLSHGTVRNYLASITRKTGARNRVDAIRISRVAGWV